MARGYNQGDIARELKIARTTVNRDMKNINEMTNKGWYNLAKVTLPTMFFNCIQGLDEVQKECWKIIENLDNNPAITVAHKLAAIRVAAKLSKRSLMSL